MTLNTLTDCDGCGKKFLVPYSISCPKGGLVLAWNNDSAKEWGSLSSWALIPLRISYEPKINSRTVKGKRNRAGARIAMGGQGAMGHNTVTDESQADVSIHGFWKWGTSALFCMHIFNLDAGSYLRQTFVKDLETAEKEKKDEY